MDIHVLDVLFAESLIDEIVLHQMQIAARFPISAVRALMPYAHPGFGLPIVEVQKVRDSLIY